MSEEAIHNRRVIWRQDWFWACLVFCGSIAIASGFIGPGTRISNVENSILNHEHRISNNETNVAVINQKLDDLIRGMNELLGHHAHKR